MFAPFLSSDINRIRHLQPEDWPPIESDFEFYVSSSFCFPLKLESEGKIIAVGTSVKFDKTAWLAHIIVNEAHRNKSLGFQLTNELIRQMQPFSPEAILLLATKAGIPVYEKIGFQPISNYIFYKRENPWKTQHFSEHIRPYNEKFREEIFAIDFTITGEDRALLLNHFLQETMLFVKNEELLGFYVQGLREGPVMAIDEIAGIELLRLKCATINKTVVPEENAAAISFLEQNGFAATGRKGMRMELGKPVKWKPGYVYARIGGSFG